MIKNLLAVFSIFAYSSTGCFASHSEDPHHIQDTSSLVEKVMSSIGLHGPHVLCGEGEAVKGIYSLRSFNGRLCKVPYIGAMATLFCSRTSGFHDSHCAKNISPSKVGISTVIEKEIEQNPVALRFFCSVSQKFPKVKGVSALAKRHCSKD